MSRRGRNDDPADDGASTAGGASSFDEAQDLLLAALAEIRGGSTAPKPAPPTASEPPTDPKAAAPAGDDGTRRSRGSRATRSPAPNPVPTPAPQFWDEPATTDPAPATSPERRRRVTPRVIPTAEGTRRLRRERPAVPESPGSEELDGLTDALYEDRSGRRRRSRSSDRPEALPPGSRRAVAGSTPAPTTPTTDDSPWAGPVAPVPVATSGRDDVTGELDPAELAAALATSDDSRSDVDGTGFDDVEEIDDLVGLEAALTGDAPRAVVAEPTAVSSFDDADDGFDEHDDGARVASATGPSARVVAAAAAGAAAGTSTRSRGPRSTGSRTRKRIGFVVAALVALLAVVVAVVALRPGGGNSPALRTTTAAKFTFAPIVTPEGAQVTRVWQLQGSRGDEFVGSLAMTNPTASPLPVSFTETIPKAIAPTAAQIEFNPRPVILQADPVVRYTVTIAPKTTFEATYRVTVAPDGATRARLEAWARDLPPASTTTTSTLAPPTTSTTVPATVAPTTPKTPVTQVPAPTTPTTEPTPVPPTTVPPPPPVDPGRIVLRVSSLNGTGTFDYSGWAGISLTTRGSPNGYAEWSSVVDPGLFPFTQTTPAGFVLRGIDCSDRDSGPFEWRSIVAPPTVTFNVQPGETVVCTFTNARQR